MGCSSVFRQADRFNGQPYNIDGKVFIDTKTGNQYTNSNSFVPIEFPYIPKTEYVEENWSNDMKDAREDLEVLNKKSRVFSLIDRNDLKIFGLHRFLYNHIEARFAAITVMANDAGVDCVVFSLFEDLSNCKFQLWMSIEEGFHFPVEPLGQRLVKNLYDRFKEIAKPEIVRYFPFEGKGIILNG